MPNIMHKPNGLHVTNYEKLYRLCGGLPYWYKDQSRARLGGFVEDMDLLEADSKLALHLVEYGLLCPELDHEDDGSACYDHSRELLRG